MYSVKCTKCAKNCRVLDVDINNDEFQAVVVTDKKFAIVTIKRVGCPTKVSIGIKDVSTGELINPHKSVLYEKPDIATG